MSARHQSWTGSSIAPQDFRELKAPALLVRDGAAAPSRSGLGILLKLSGMSSLTTMSEHSTTAPAYGLLMHLPARASTRKNQLRNDDLTRSLVASYSNSQ